MEWSRVQEPPSYTDYFYLEEPSLVLQLSPGSDAKRTQELTEVNSSVPIGIKCSKDVLGELPRVSIGEKIAVDLFEFLFGQLAARTVFQKSFIPFVDLRLSKLRVVPQVVQKLRF